MGSDDSNEVNDTLNLMLSLKALFKRTGHILILMFCQFILHHFSGG